MPADPVRLPLYDSARPSDATDDVRAEQSHDLVFGVVGYLGAGATWVATRFESVLAAAGYEAHQVKLSALIEEQADHREQDQAKRTTLLQDLGDDLREKNGSSIIAAMGVHAVRRIRQAGGNERARAFILDQLKHPKEVELLRAVYGHAFYLISVVCSESTRQRRLKLKYKGADEDARDKLAKRDRLGEDVDHGQRVHKAFHLGDLFVVNEGEPDSPEQQALDDELARFLDAITGRKITRPRPSEIGMHAAWVASLRSACLSRQVGAAIVDRHGEVIAVGRNDPPAFGGGLYGDAPDDDHRCYNWNDKPDIHPRGYCRNDISKQQIYRQIMSELIGRGLLKPECTPEDLEKALASTQIKDLIEFSRAVHAEMDALISLARQRGPSPNNGTLYCTTYPCHSCARHLVAAGIREVIYIEPYDKSMALELHGDAISDIAESDRMHCRLFSGIAPRRFSRIFEKRTDLKSRDGYVQNPSISLEHMDPVLKKSFLDLEHKVADEVGRKLLGEGVA